MSYIKRALEKFHKSEEHEAAFQAWALEQPAMQSVPREPKYLCTIENVDLGELGTFDCMFYGNSDFCAEYKSYMAHITKITINGLGESMVIIQADKLAKMVVQRLSTAVEEQLTKEAQQ